MVTEHDMDSVCQRGSAILATGSWDDSCQAKLAQNEVETGTGHIGRKSYNDVEAKAIYDAEGADAASANVANELIICYLSQRVELTSYTKSDARQESPGRYTE